MQVKVPNFLCLHILAVCFIVTMAIKPSEVLGSTSPKITSVQDARQSDTALHKGIQLFNEEKYAEALAIFQEVAKVSPKDPYTNLWLGMALEANAQPYAAMDVWRTGYGNPKWEPVADYLKAMSWWKMGYTKDALAYFNDALLNVTDGKQVDFKPAQDAIKLLNEGASVPHFKTWPELSNLTHLAQNTPSFTSTKPATPTENTSPGTKESVVAKPVEEVKPKTTSPVATLKPGATPKPGKWVATISNGYKGDVLTFRVSPDGKTITDVEFTGHWKSGSYGIEVLKNLDPPSPFKVVKGNFSAVKQNSKAGMWWEFIGRFSSATTGEGSYRATFAGGDNDTYKLKWTAKRVGP